MNANAKNLRSNASSSLTVTTVRTLKRSKSTDKYYTTKYSDSSDRMESHYYDKLQDIRSGEHKHKKRTTSQTTSGVVTEEEIKSVGRSSKSPEFPSLPDVILRKLQLLRENSCSLESLTEQEVESKFATLSIAFKTDKQTLEQRVKHHKHRRDVAEEDANNELNQLREYVHQLNRVITSLDEVLSDVKPELKELLHRIDTQVDVVGHTNGKISSICELYGAVKQEERVSSAFDVVLLYSENLIRAHDKDIKELERTKKLFITTNGQKKTDFDTTDSDGESVPLRRSLRSISTTVIPRMNLIGGRRASVSAIEILPNLDSHRKSVQPTTGSRHVPNSASYLNRSRRCSMPVTPAMIRNGRTSADAEPSLLEMTAEEKSGFDSDCSVSSVPNEASDEEPNTPTKDCIKQLDSNSSNSSEPNNNSPPNIIKNNIYNDLISHEFRQQMSANDHKSDEQSSSDESDLHKNYEISYQTDDKQSDDRVVSIIEYNYLIKSLRFCLDGRLTSYGKRLLNDMRFIVAVVLLVSAMLIMVWSVLPTGIPCECHCTCSWHNWSFGNLFGRDSNH